MQYRIEQWANGRWYALGGKFATYEEASNKVQEYLRWASRKHPPQLRIVRK